MADEVCYAPDGSEMWTFGLNNLPRTVSFALIIGFCPLVTVLLGPKLISWAGRTAGLYLRKKTAGRKAQILELTEKDQAEWEEDEKDGKSRRDSDDWESVDAYAVGTAQNGEKGEEEWDGIVGFFHPFW
jgi:alpha-1,2-mannosyltransferase